MKQIPQDDRLLDALSMDPALAPADVQDFSARFDVISHRFHSHFAHDGQAQHANALFHKRRYVDLLSRPWPGNVLDVGNDKPFLSFFLRWFNPGSAFWTISNEIPQSPFPIWEVDIEKDIFPFDSALFNQVIFTEVIEHLWRNPSFCLTQINRVTRNNGGIFVTTPNPCDRHSLVCVLWQANPNQRSQYFKTLESGHLHLWTVADVRLILEEHGYRIDEAVTQDLYGHTRDDAIVEEVIARISPYRPLMNETVVIGATKQSDVSAPVYPSAIYPDGSPVQFMGAITGFIEDSVKERGGR